MTTTELREQLIGLVAGEVQWKIEAIHEALRENYEIRFRTSSKPIELKGGDVAFADNGVLAVLSFEGDVTEEIKNEFSKEDVEEMKELFQKGKDVALLLKAERKN